MRHWTRGLVIVTLGALLAGCGPGGDGPGGAGGDQDLPTSARTNSDDEREPHGLRAGSYRLQWSARDCDRPSLQLTDANTGETVWENARPSVAVIVVQNLPAGEYFIDQLNEECSSWSVQLTRF